MSSLLARALPWIKANANETALRWAQQEVKARRQVTLRQRAAAATGSVDSRLALSGWPCTSH